MSKTGVFNQFLATITCNILSIGYGSSLAWTGPNFLTLTSNDTVLSSGPLSTYEGSLVVSLPFLVATIGILVYTLALDRIGRKSLFASLAILQTLSWLTLLFASNVYHLYVGRLAMGFVGGGVMKIIPTYVSEIADDRIRGALNSMMILTMNAGFLVGYILVDFLDYYGQIKANITYPMLFLALFNFFPESPGYLLRQQQAAEQSKQFYSGVKVTPSSENGIDQQEKAYDKFENENMSLSLADFCNPAAKKATTIAIFLGILNQFCGVFAMSSYTQKVFIESGSSLSSNHSSIIVAAFQFLANCVAMVLVDKVGRKILITISTVGTSIGLICMGLHDLHKEQLDAYRWIPIASFSTIIMMASIGILPLTFVVLSEIAPKKIKNATSFLCLQMIFLLAFFLLLFYPTLTEKFGAYNCMFGFAAFCVFGSIFFCILLPETKGKSYDEIMRALEK